MRKINDNIVKYCHKHRMESKILYDKDREIIQRR